MARDGFLTKRGKHIRTRRYPGIRGRRPDHHTAHVNEAAERLVIYQSIAPSAHITRLDAMFGKGKGANRERARLAKRMKGAST
jgi:hypothetical protein